MALGKFFAKTNTELTERITKLEAEASAAAVNLERATAEAKTSADALVAMTGERDSAVLKAGTLETENAELKARLEKASKEAADAAAVSAPKVIDAAVDIAAKQGVPIKNAASADVGASDYETFIAECFSISDSSKRADFWAANINRFIKR